MSLHEFLAELNSGDAGDPSPGLTEEQQVTRLREIHALKSVTHRFTPGQIIRHKFGSMSGARTGRACILFQGYLRDPIDPAHKAQDAGSVLSTAAARGPVDCRIGMIDGEGDFVPFLDNSADYEPHPDFNQPEAAH